MKRRNYVEYWHPMLKRCYLAELMVAQNCKSIFESNLPEWSINRKIITSACSAPRIYHSRRVLGNSNEPSLSLSHVIYCRGCRGHRSRAPESRLVDRMSAVAQCTWDALCDASLEDPSEFAYGRKIVKIHFLMICDELCRSMQQKAGFQIPNHQNVSD